jgi:hypothetical protein
MAFGSPVSVSACFIDNTHSNICSGGKLSLEHFNSIVIDNVKVSLFGKQLCASGRASMQYNAFSSAQKILEDGIGPNSLESA